MNASQINVASHRFCSLEQVSVDAVDMTLEDQEDACRDASLEKHNFYREQREIIQVMNVKRKRDFLCLEKVNGEMVNILEGLELHTDVFNAAEQQTIVDKVCELQEKARKGELKRAFTPKGKGRSAIQFGCCFNYKTSKDGNRAGILRHDTVDPLPSLFKVIIRRLVKWHVLPPTCVPDCCVVNIYDEGDCIPPHVDNHDFLRPFCTVSFLSECNILFGSNLKLEENGDYSGGSYSLPLPIGSVLVLNGNGANVAKHCVPEVPTKRISITFRKMNESKRPIWFTPEPDLQWTHTQPLPFELESSSSSDHSFLVEKKLTSNKYVTTGLYFLTMNYGHGLMVHQKPDLTVDNHDFLRPFCTVSFLSECNILFGSNLKLEENGDYSGGSYSLPLPIGSVLVLNGNGANVAKHCVPEVPTKRISITFRKMNESKRPIWFTPEPDLQWTHTQPLPFELESSSSSDHVY
ncbi:2-oxoglutarate [Hirschfeldia incana]|nr:2-oxoglutarate [Hirschfeldia incana]